MRKVIVCGSIAYDHIMDFPGYFKDQILPDKIASLNVSFLVNSLQKLRGGTAPNIAYNLALVGEKPFIVGTAGRDFPEYRDWLANHSVETSYIRILEDDYTASCFITTDRSNNQITGFYPGAMAKDPEISLKNLAVQDAAMVVIAPTVPEAMLKWAVECQEMGIPYLFDPGMQIPRLSGEELRRGVLGATIAIFNDYEYDLMRERTGLDRETILKSVKLLVVTKGAEGSMLCNTESEVSVPAARATEVLDPTGAGDAYRAGLLKGYFDRASLEITGRYGSISAVYAVEHKGGTGHKYTVEEFNHRYQSNFGGK